MRLGSNLDHRGAFIPHVTIKTGAKAPDGREEQISEYLCDSPGCPNIATRVLGLGGAGTPHPSGFAAAGAYSSGAEKALGPCLNHHLELLYQRRTRRARSVFQR